MGYESKIETAYRELEIVDGHAVKAPEDYQDPKVLYDKLIARVRKYHPSADISMIEKAFDIAYHAHEGQFRKSGEPYITHPMNVALILISVYADYETISAGLLHDVLEDCDCTPEEMTEAFGENITKENMRIKLINILKIINTTLLR